MSIVIPLLVVAAMVAFAVLASLFGADSRPGLERRTDVERPPDRWVGQRSG